MSRSITVRARTLSALDAIADGPQAKAHGITQRLHDVAERYAAMVATASNDLSAHEFALIALAVGSEELPAIGHRDALRHILSALMTSAGRAAHQRGAKDEYHTLARTFLAMDCAHLVAVLERIEEGRAG